MLIDRDVAVTVSPGEPIYVDVYRPDSPVPAAPLIAWSPYGKHNPAPIGILYPRSGVRPEHTSPLTTFEAPDPQYWVPHGYAIVTADIPGTWYSRGRATYCSPEEAQAFAQLIEWAGTQPWSNGRVGLSGVSYLTTSQWRVAELSPPHLAAINPWEGWNDTYREVVRHGGIPETWFWPYIWQRWGASVTEIEDLAAETAAHPFYDDFWRSKSADLEKITVPAFVVASWSDHGLHSRGTLEGFRRISSAHKWLDVHGRKKWAYYYDPESVERQRVFFDYFLRDRGPRPGGLAGRPDGGTRVVLPGHGAARPAGGRRPRPSTARSTCAHRRPRAPRAPWSPSQAAPRARSATTAWAPAWPRAGPSSRSPSPPRPS